MRHIITMNKPNFLALEPLDGHTCAFCKRAVLDIDKGYVCRLGGFILEPLQYVATNDCTEFDSEWQNDLRKYKAQYRKP